MGAIDSRWVPAVTLAVLVLTAGCSSVLPGDGAPGTTAGPGTAGPGDDTPTATPTPEPTPTPIDYPPGLTADGYGDRDELVAGHVDVLEGTSFRGVTRLSFDDRTVTIVVRGDPDRQRVTKVRSEDGEATGKFYWADGSADTAVGFAGGEMSYREALTFDGQFETLFWASLADPELDTSGEQTVFTYDVVGLANDDSAEVTGTVRVRADGLVLRYTIEQADGPDIRYEVGGLGTTTVDEPSWAGLR